MIIKERKIGEIFEVNGITLQVQLANDKNKCMGCYYNEDPYCYKPYEITGPCTSVGKDKVHIIFKKIN